MKTSIDQSTSDQLRLDLQSLGLTICFCMARRSSRGSCWGTCRAFEDWLVGCWLIVEVKVEQKVGSLGCVCVCGTGTRRVRLRVDGQGQWTLSCGRVVVGSTGRIYWFARSERSCPPCVTVGDFMRKVDDSEGSLGRSRPRQCNPTESCSAAVSI